MRPEISENAMSAEICAAATISQSVAPQDEPSHNATPDTISITAKNTVAIFASMPSDWNDAPNVKPVITAQPIRPFTIMKPPAIALIQNQASAATA